MGNVSKDCSVDNMEKTGFYEYVFDDTSDINK